MASVYGSRVKEPKLTMRSTLPFSASGSQTRDLEQAWATFGEAKSVLQRLEAGMVSPTVSKGSKPARRKKIRNVKFDSGVTTGTGERSSYSKSKARKGVTDDRMELEDMENMDGNQYLVEPVTLNETGGHQEWNAQDLLRTYSAPPSQNTKGSAPVVNSSQYPSSPHLKSPSNPNNVGSPPCLSGSSHSNAGAVFGQPVKFGSWDKSRPTLEGAEHPKPPLSSTSPHYPHHHPSTFKNLPTSQPPSLAAKINPSLKSSDPPLKSSSATTQLPSSSAKSRYTSRTSSHSQQVPLRKFELPAETLSSLKAVVETQRKVVDSTGSKLNSLQQQAHLNSGFYPLTEASTTTTSSQTTPAHQNPPPSNLSHLSQSRKNHDNDAPITLATKKRKVATAPPPREYAGFSASGVGHAPYRTRPISSTRYSGSSGTRREGKSDFHKEPAAVTGVKVHQHLRPSLQYTTDSNNAGRVRKVFRLDTEDGDDPAFKADLITPSSWRTGKELAERMLKGDQEKEKGVAKTSSVHSPSYRSYHDSLNSVDHSLSEMTSSVSDSSVSVNGTDTAKIGTSHSQSNESSVSSDSSRSEASSELSSHNSTLEDHPRAAQLSSDMKKLLVELQASSSHEMKTEVTSKPVRKDEQGERGGRRTLNGPTTKKVKYNSYEPTHSHSLPKNRHYDQGEVQRFIQQKKEERRRKAQEEFKAQARDARIREEKLRTLYETQRRKVEANLRQKQKQREMYSRSAAAATADIHIRINEPDSEPFATSTSLHSPSPHHSPSGLILSSKASTSFLSHSPSHPTLHPSPPSHPPTYTSPPRYSSFHTPLGEGHNHRSPQRRTHDREKSPSPHRSYSISPGKSLSPHRTLPTSHHTTTTPPVSRSYLSTPPTSHYTATPTRTYHGSHGSHVTTHSPSSGRLASLLRSSEYSPTGESHQPPPEKKSREERIQAIAAAALDLKKKILEQTQKVSESESRRRYGESVSPRWSTNWRSYQTNAPLINDNDLPGVRDLQEHASQAEKAKRETEAALKIQSAYRGFRVRKSLQWTLPSGGTLGSAIQGTRGGGDGGEEEEEEDSSTLTPEEDNSDQSEASSNPTRPAVSQIGGAHGLRDQYHQINLKTEETTPTDDIKEPWKQVGGDSYSIINIYTSQHECNFNEDLIKTEKQSEEPSSKKSDDYSYSQDFESSSQITESMNKSKGVESSTPDLSAHSSRDSFFSAESEIVAVSPNTKESHSDYTPEASPTKSNVSKSNSLSSSFVSQSPQDGASPSVITPPGTPSFVESYASSITPQLIPPLPNPRLTDESTNEPDLASEGRLSPRSLELKLHAELNLLETVEASMRHVTQVENTRAVSLAQQETVALAQLYQSSKKTQEKDETTTSEKAESQKGAVDITKRVRDEVEGQMDLHAGKLSQMKQESVRSIQNLEKRLSEVESVTSTQHNQEQQQIARDLAVTVASVAAKEAVRGVLRRGLEPPGSSVGGDDKDGNESTPVGSEHSPMEQSYESDFEETSSTIRTESGVAEGGGDSTIASIPESLTPMASEREDSKEEGTEKDRTISEDLGSRAEDEEEEEFTEEIEEDINEVSFRQVLPSESHRRHQTPHAATKPHPLHSRNSSFTSDGEDRVWSPSRPITPVMSDTSLFSPTGATEDSFYNFVSRMVHAYVREEEVRGKHQAALLQLREKALTERTKVELEWLKLREKDLKSKGADDQMPPLRKREEGLLKKLQQEQAEIQTLKAVQEAARQERKLMMLQQKEISKMRRSTHYYREKIHKYRQRSRASPSPDLNLERDADGIRISQSMDEQLSYSIGMSDFDRESSMAPSEQMDELYHASSPVKKDSSTATPLTNSPEKTPQSKSMPSWKRTSKGSPMSASPLTTNASESLTVQNLSSHDTERYLAEREQRLMKRRQAAEEALKKQKELLEREQSLTKEEKAVHDLIGQVKETYSKRQNRHKSSKKTEQEMEKSEYSERIDLSSKPESLMESVNISNTSESIKEEISRPSFSAGGTHNSVASKQFSSASIPEVITEDSVSQIRTEMSLIPSDYAQDTFESSTFTPRPSDQPLPVIITSTPASEDRTLPPPAPEEYSLSESLKLSQSMSDMTETSDGSTIEARIRTLKEQLRQRQEEVKRVKNEQKRKKKAMLMQHEERLKKKLEVMDSKVKEIKSLSPINAPLTHFTTVHSLTHSEISNSEVSSRSASVTPDLEQQRLLTPTPELDNYQRQRSITAEHDESDREKNKLSPTAERIGKSSSIRSETQSPAEERSSYSPSYTSSLTSLTGSIESKISEVISTDEDEEERESGGSHTPPEIGEVVETSYHTPPEDDDMNADETLTELGVAEKYSDSTTTENHETPSIAEETKENYSSNFEPESYSELMAGSEDALEDTDVTPRPFKTMKKLEEHSNSERSEDGSSSYHHQVVEKQRERSDSDRSDSLLMSATPSQGGDMEDEEKFHVGQQVLVGNKMMGVVRFVGNTHFAPGLWIGVEIAVPKGRNNGSIDGQMYFTCEPKHGLFAPPHKVTVVGESDSISSISEELEEESTGKSEKVESGGSYLPSDLEKSTEKDKSFENEERHDDLPSDDSEREEFERSLEKKETSLTLNIQEAGESSSLVMGKEDQVKKTNSNVSEVSDLSLSSSQSEQPAPPMLETRGEKPEGLPLAPEVVSIRSQSATPTPAPPPEFAEGASRETSIEPPSLQSTSSADKLKATLDNKAKSDRLSDGIVQDLTNEAFEAVHKIWKSRHQGASDEKEPRVLQITRDKVIPLTLDEKADKITDELLIMLLKAESNLACDIHTSKVLAAQEEEEEKREEEEEEEEIKEEEKAQEESGSKPMSAQDELVSPTKRFIPPPHLIINTASGFPIESSPPPLSPPSPYRSPPPTFITNIHAPSSSDYSPPGSPPRHLSQPSAARVAAGEKSPFFSHHEIQTLNKQSPAPTLERSTSTESVFELLESIKLRTAQCMVPSERENVNKIVSCAWNHANSIGFGQLHSVGTIECPSEVHDLFSNFREMNPDEEHCQAAYVNLIYRLSFEVIKKLCPVKETIPIWASHCTVRSLLAPSHFSNSVAQVEEVQRRVYAALMRGQLPNQLPAVKFLYNMKRPGGREVDFVDQILIRELRKEEPSWVDYSKDEVVIKEKTADVLLESLIEETVDVLRSIAEKRRIRQLNRQQLPSRTPS